MPSLASKLPPIQYFYGILASTSTILASNNTYLSAVCAHAHTPHTNLKVVVLHTNSITQNLQLAPV